MSYKLIVARVTDTFPINGANNVHCIKVLNEVLVANKSVEVGTIGIFAETDIQLSEEFAIENNLYRDKEKNKNKEIGGFFEDTRRVRAQPFLGIKSAGFFFDKNMLNYTGANTDELALGQEFDILNGHQLAQKYVSEKQKEAMGNAQNANAKMKKRDVIGFAEHVQTGQFKYAINSINVGDLLSFHAKKHGTSFRVGKHLVKQELPFHKRIVNKLFKTNVFPEYKYDFVIGTRRVILKDSKADGFHGSEEFRYKVAEILKPFIKDGMTFYGEIVGCVNNKPIMGTHNTEKLKMKEYTKKYGKVMDYKYGTKNDECAFHIYRITNIINGEEVDMTANQLDAFAERTGISVHYKIHESIVYDGNKEALLALVDKLTERPEVLTEDYIDPTHISEGIIIRVDNGKNIPMFLKNKSFAFKIMEGIYKENNVDLEDAN